MARPRRVIVGILWDDTQSHSDNSDVQPCPMVTVGELVADEPTFIRIRSEIHADGASRDFVAIPKGVITRIIRIGSFVEPKEFMTYRAETSG